MFELSNEFQKIIDHLLHEGGSILVASVALAVVSALSVFLGWLYREIRAAWRYFKRLQRARSAVARETSNGVRREGKGIWLAEPIRVPAAISSIYQKNQRVLAIGNLKGGVGKTTLAANIGACLAERMAKPILLVDLDFQGSLSSMASPMDWLPQNGYDSKATALIGGECSPAELAQTVKTAAGVPNLKLITSYYDLAQAENRLLIEWLLSDRKNDVRFRLAELFQCDQIQNAFGLIILDLPPRLTTASVQALCSASHLLVPTILDKTSADAVYTFIDQVEILREAKICEHLSHLGVVGTVVDRAANYHLVENEIGDRLRSKGICGSSSIELLPPETYLYKNRIFRQTAERGIAYVYGSRAAEFQQVREPIEALSNKIKEKMGLIFKDGA